MATRKGSSSSKTAHVLNVISGDSQPTGTPETGAEETQAVPARESASSRQPVPPILEVVKANDDALSEQIRNAIEQEVPPAPVPNGPASEDRIAEILAQQAASEPAQAPTPASDSGVASEDRIAEILAQQAAQAPAPASDSGVVSDDRIAEILAQQAAQEPAQAPVPASDSGVASEDRIAEILAQQAAQEPVQAPAPASDSGVASEGRIAEILAQQAASEPAQAPVPASDSGVASEDRIAEILAQQATAEPAIAPANDATTQTPSAPVQPVTAYVNVIESLVEEKAMRYIGMFGLCDCPRCIIDVKALALTNLPAKYVVRHSSEIVPMLTVYESRYSTAVTAQLIRACKIVMDSPRHER